MGTAFVGIVLLMSATPSLPFTFIYLFHFRVQCLIAITQTEGFFSITCIISSVLCFIIVQFIIIIISSILIVVTHRTTRIRHSQCSNRWRCCIFYTLRLLFHLHSITMLSNFVVADNDNHHFTT